MCDATDSMRAGMASLSILFVDDDPIVLHRLAAAAEGGGHTVRIASNAAAALRIAEAVRPDVAVVDLRIGNDWGIDVIESLKFSGPATKIFVLSGILSAAAATQAMLAGATNVLSKPIRPSVLVAIIEGGHLRDPLVS